MSPTTVDRLIAILERAQRSATSATHDAAQGYSAQTEVYADDARQQVEDALALLRAEQAETERDLNVQAARQ